MAIKKLWTIEQKRDFVAEYEAATYGTKTDLLLERGVSGWELRCWRASRDAGLLEYGVTPAASSATPRRESAEIARLRAEVARLEAELVRARQDVDQRQDVIDTLGKATALLHELVSGKSAEAPLNQAPSNDTASS